MRRRREDDAGLGLGLGRRGTEMAQHGIELRPRRRLLDGADDAHAIRLRHRGRGGQENAVESADEDHRYGKLSLADAPDELHAVHSGHLEIGHDDVDRVAGTIQKGERLVSRRRLDDARRAHAGQRPGKQVALVAVVVDDQKAQAVEIDRLRVGNQLHHDAPPAGRSGARAGKLRSPPGRRAGPRATSGPASAGIEFRSSFASWG